MGVFEEQLRGVVLSDPSIGALLGGRVYPHVAPQDVRFPFVTFSQVGARRFHTLNTGAQETYNPSIQYSFWSERYLDNSEISNLFRVVLNGFQGAFDGVFFGHVMLSDEFSTFEPPSDGTETPVHRTIQTYSVWVKETLS